MLSDAIIEMIREGKVKFRSMSSAERRQADREELAKRRKEWLRMSALSEAVINSYDMRGDRPSPKVCWFDESKTIEKIGRKILN